MISASIGGHHQVLGGQLQAHRLHQLDIPHVLTGDFRHRDVEDIDVLFTDQVQQQIQGAFEGFEEDFEGIRRDVQVQRHFHDRLAIDHGEGQLLLGSGLTVDGFYCRHLGLGHERRGIAATDADHFRLAVGQVDHGGRLDRRRNRRR